MSDEKTSDEPAAVQVVAGPYAGQRLTMSRADADAAIAEKWAVDPSALPPKEEAKPMTEEERAEIKAKAEKAARKLRGEPEPEEPAKEAAKPDEPAKPAVDPQPTRQETATRDLGADKPPKYQTRDVTRK